VWVGPRQVNPTDLPWIVAEWLLDGVLAIPADAQSASQDAFLKVGGRIIGIAFKTVSSSEPTTWRDLNDEIGKARSLGACTLVLWTLQLGSELQSAFGEPSSATFGEGTWWHSSGSLVCAASAPSPATLAFTVPPGMDVVVANPQSKTGGLRELLGSDTWEELRHISQCPAYLPAPPCVCLIQPGMACRQCEQTAEGRAARPSVFAASPPRSSSSRNA